MIDKVVETILKYDMIQQGSRVIAAVSGGSDSMAMLFCLNALKEKFGFSLEVAHVNHCLRGKDSDADEKYVEGICRKWNIQFHLLRADVAALAKQNGTGTEEEGRKIRYEFFASLGADAIIATAHNLNDREETFLFNFARGSALRGLCSIPAKRDNIIRPVINCTKAEINDFCDRNGIGYVTDKTNSDTVYARNRIRHNVITELKKINPGFDECASRCIENINEDEKFLSLLADGLLAKAETESGYSAVVIASAPEPIKRRAIIRIVESQADATPDSGAVERISSILSGGVCEINGGIRIRVRRGMIEFPSPEEEIPAPAEFENGRAECGNLVFTCEIVNKSEMKNSEKIHPDALEYFLDYDKIVGRLSVRCRQDGDKIRLYPSGCTKSLKKLFNEKAIPPETRASLPMLTDENGIILIPGIGFDSGVRVSENTVKIIRITIKG